MRTPSILAFVYHMQRRTMETYKVGEKRKDVLPSNQDWCKAIISAIDESKSTVLKSVEIINQKLLEASKDVECRIVQFETIYAEYDQATTTYRESALTTQRVVHMNVGGKNVDISLECIENVLAKSLFTLILQPRWHCLWPKDKNGRLFLDLSPEWVDPMFDALRAMNMDRDLTLQQSLEDARPIDGASLRGFSSLCEFFKLPVRRSKRDGTIGFLDSSIDALRNPRVTSQIIAWIRLKVPYRVMLVRAARYNMMDSEFVIVGQNSKGVTRGALLRNRTTSETEICIIFEYSVVGSTCTLDSVENVSVTIAKSGRNFALHDNDDEDDTTTTELFKLGIEAMYRGTSIADISFCGTKWTFELYKVARCSEAMKAASNQDSVGGMEDKDHDDKASDCDYDVPTLLTNSLHDSLQASRIEDDVDEVIEGILDFDVIVGDINQTIATLDQKIDQVAEEVEFVSLFFHLINSKPRSQDLPEQEEQNKLSMVKRQLRELLKLYQPDDTQRSFVPSSSSLLYFNCGGQLFCTSRAMIMALVPDSQIVERISGDWKEAYDNADTNGSMYYDFPPGSFAALLHNLRLRYYLKKKNSKVSVHLNPRNRTM